MFKHADTRYALELAGDVTIILQGDLNPILKASLFYSLYGEIVLVLGDGDTDALGAEFNRGT